MNCHTRTCSRKTIKYHNAGQIYLCAKFYEIRYIKVRQTSSLNICYTCMDYHLLDVPTYLNQFNIVSNRVKKSCFHTSDVELLQVAHAPRFDDVIGQYITHALMWSYSIF